jgi:hypothetical protein
VDTVFIRLGLSKPSDMIRLIDAKLGNEAAKTFAEELLNSKSRREKDE